jgi:hypothetical protein
LKPKSNLLKIYVIKNEQKIYVGYKDGRIINQKEDNFLLTGDIV